MNGCEYRTDADAILDPQARERLIGAGHIQLVTVQLHDTGYHVDDSGDELPRRPAVRCELRTDEARKLAISLLGRAEQADRLTREAGR